MSDLHALIRACKDEPEDDAPRLILADWLDEHGEPERAAFIRKQIANPEITEELCPINLEWLGAWEHWRQEWLLDRNNPIKSPSHAIRSRRGFFRIADVYRELYDRLERILRPPFD